MARPMTVPVPLDTLEEAFDLLQHAPVSAWFRYLIGAAPLIVGLLYVWNDFSSAVGTRDTPVMAALLLCALVVWFYRCRQIFAARLRRILVAEGGAAGKVERTGWSAACFEGTKVLAMPIATLSVLPAAYFTAFYRSLALFAGPGLCARDAASKAWKASTVWQRENWFVLAILSLLVIVVLVNVALLVILAPLLVKIFTGYESVSTERGVAAFGIQFPIILALTWLCLDPLVQSVYVVRAFHWEGQRTGEDLLVRLQRLAPLLLLALCVVRPVFAEPSPTLSRDTLNQSIDRTLRAPEYDWRNPPAGQEADKKDWFIDTVDNILAFLHRCRNVLSKAWSDLVEWIVSLLRPVLPAPEPFGQGKPVGVRPVFYGIGIVILALALVLLWKFRPRRNTVVPEPVPVAKTVDLNNEGLLASDLPEDEWLRMADRYIGSGDLRLALRALYLGTLALLSSRGFLTIHACKSNRDYERELRRRARNTGLSQVFRLNIRSFEQSWYGFHLVTSEQLQDFRENLGRMRANAS